MQQTQRYHVFYSTHSSSLSKPGAYVTNNTTWLPTVGLEIRVCYASSGKHKQRCGAGYRGLVRNFFLHSYITWGSLSDFTQLPLEPQKALYNFIQ